jgi:hypothetical protein
MGYREQSPPNTSQMTIDGELYAVDSFGMDDGRQHHPNDAFRFIFQLGTGYTMFLYVIQAGALNLPRHFFHTFWYKGIITVDTEMEDWGPPQSVVCAPISLPLLYTSVAVHGVAFAIENQTFVADGESLTMRFELAGREPLVWTRATGWSMDGPLVFSPAAD